MAEALGELPELSEALRSGTLCWSAARELARVATQQTEAEWLQAARGHTVHEVERLVSGRRPGDRPRDPSLASAPCRVVATRRSSACTISTSAPRAAATTRAG